MITEGLQNGLAVFHHIFGGGLTIMSVYLTMVALDIITGYLGL